MSLSVPCTCGKTYKVDESLAGRRVKCKACGGALVVPQAPLPADGLDDLSDLSDLIMPAAATPSAPAEAAALPETPSASPQGFPDSTPTGGLPFFLAVSQGWSKSLIYRVYVDHDALLFLDVSPYNVFVDLEVARRADGSHWGVKTVQSLKTWIVSTGGVVLAVIGMLGVGLARFSFKKPNEVLQIISLLLIIAAFVIPGLTLLATWTMRILVRRSQEIDALSPNEIRGECAKGGDKYRLAPGELSDVRVNPPKNPGPATKQLAEATFKHPSGNWRLLLFAPQDVRQALAALRQFLGRNLDCDPALERL